MILTYLLLLERVLDLVLSIPCLALFLIILFLLLFKVFFFVFLSLVTIAHKVPESETLSQFTTIVDDCFKRGVECLGKE